MADRPAATARPPVTTAPVPAPATRSAAKGAGQASPAPGDLAEFRFLALAEHVFDAVVVIGLDGRVLFVSSSAERLFGYDPGDAVGPTSSAPRRRRASGAAGVLRRHGRPRKL